MGWKYIYDENGSEIGSEFESPDHDSPPITFICENVFNLIVAQQARAIAWWNNRWSEKMNYTLRPISEAAMEIGLPTTFTAEHLYIIPLLDIDEKDNYEDQRMVVSIVYVPGSVQAAGTAASKFAEVKVTDFYLKMLLSILQTAPQTEFTKGWPAEGKPAKIAKFAKIERPDAKIIQDPSVHGAITMQMLINPIPIKPINYLAVPAE